MNAPVKPLLAASPRPDVTARFVEAAGRIGYDQLGEEEVYAKLVGSFTYGPSALTDAQAEVLIQRIERLEGVDDIATLFDQAR